MVELTRQSLIISTARNVSCPPTFKPMRIPGLKRINVNKIKVEGAEWQRYREQLPRVTLWGC